MFWSFTQAKNKKPLVSTPASPPLKLQQNALLIKAGVSNSFSAAGHTYIHGFHTGQTFPGNDLRKSRDVFRNDADHQEKKVITCNASRDF